ncbi:TauD/TfdA dioxygenase family protein [Novosphingobium malaysiense]|uniref:Taurine catabolism dioxygenase TauD n=1 Tax=Novosphingobium malaysiense TaxID=1348853 RepID=A0A0B1ZIT2_9SPHN|nr:TauD/TfdA family dioxygenase [Novosphingobium malaysiense]KHK89173.1 taurine catabolism dioxygenase TauD [Novosphingobium malaysiense]
MVRVLPLPGGIGAQMVGLDLSRELTDEERQSVMAAWTEYGLLLVRDPRADDAAQLRLSNLFGKPEPSATPQLNDPYNDVMMTLAYEPGDPKGQFKQHYAIGGIERAGWLGWHWDQSFMPTIVRGAVLRMTSPAKLMGRTGFIDAIAAYDRLPDMLKTRIEDLEVVYEFNPDFASGQFGFPEDIRKLVVTGDDPAKAMRFPPVIHPLVIRQPETGRKVLKLSPMHARYILGMDRAESDALLAEVADRLVNTGHTYFHDWQTNDMLVWDNWRMIHSAEGVPLDCPRSARRTTISGDYNVGRYLDDALDREREVERIVD